MTFDPSSVPASELERIEAAEKRNRSRAKKYGRKVLPVSVRGLLLLQNGKCHKSGKPLIFDPDHPDYANGRVVIAHEERLAWNQSKGHVPGNVWLWRHDENAAEAYKREASDFAKARHMAVDWTGKDKPKAEKPAKKRKIQSCNTLSKEYRQAVKERIER